MLLPARCSVRAWRGDMGPYCALAVEPAAGYLVPRSQQQMGRARAERQQAQAHAPSTSVRSRKASDLTLKLVPRAPPSSPTSARCSTHARYLCALRCMQLQYVFRRSP